MKSIFISVLLLLMLTSTGCSLFGWYDQGDPDPHPRPSDMEEWTKLNTDEVKRKEDWISCGGNIAGYFVFSEQKHGQSLADHSIQAQKEYDAGQACMMKNGYKFIGSCRGPLGRRLSCKGRSIFNL